MIDVVRNAPRNVGRGFVGLARDRTILTLSVLFGVAIASLLWNQSRQSARLVEASALQHASQYSEAIAEMRSLYTSEVVRTATDHGIQATHDYQDREGAIPLPATLSMLLGNRLAKNTAGGQTRLYSPYPFPWRSDNGGLRDDFSEQAWEAFLKQPDQPFYRFGEIDGKPSLRYATADVMRASCVRCHNSHPDTPKHDWKEGDVRGVLEITLPLDAAVALASSELRESSFVVAGLFTLGLACLTLVVTRFRRASAELETHVAERTAELNRSNQQLSHKTELVLRSNQELEAVNDQLETSRRAVINMMRDADDARRNAEHAEQALRLQAQQLQQANVDLAGEVAERKQAEAELRKLSRAVEQSPISIMITNARGMIEYVNPKFTRLTGFTLQEVIGQTPRIQRSGKMPKETIKQLWDTILAGDIWRGELLNKKKDGELYWEFASISPILDEEGQVTHFVAVKENITERKRAEDELARLNNELITTSRKAGKAEVATEVLHNVGNVLNSVNVSATSLLEQRRKSATTRLEKAATMIDENAGNLGHFVTEDERGRHLPVFLKQLSRKLCTERDEAIAGLDKLLENIEHIRSIINVQQGFAKMSGAVTEVRLDQLIEDALHTVDTSLLRHDIDLIRDFQETPSLVTDKHKVLLILINLLTNAKHALTASGNGSRQLTLRILRVTENRVAVEVADNGVGIESSDLAMVFEHGFTTKKDGHGFGLHSSANVAKVLGGTLSVASDGPGRGTTFRLELPLRKKCEDLPATANNEDMEPCMTTITG